MLSALNSLLTNIIMGRFYIQKNILLPGFSRKTDQTPQLQLFAQYHTCISKAGLNKYTQLSLSFFFNPHTTKHQKELRITTLRS